MCCVLFSLPLSLPLALSLALSLSAKEGERERDKLTTGDSRMFSSREAVHGRRLGHRLGEGQRGVLCPRMWVRLGQLEEDLCRGEWGCE